MGYHVGDMTRIWSEFTTDHTLTDPTTITLKVLDPGGTETSYVYGTDPEVEKDAAGKYHADIALDISGEWHYKWYGTGAAHAADEGSFEVEKSEFD